jgi:hypothetical protein
MNKSENIKSIIIVLAFVVILVQLLSDKPIMAQSGEKGEMERFQLFQGHYTHFDQKLHSSVELDGLFKIDTQTGVVWLYESDMDDAGVLHKAWLKSEM